MPLLRRLKLNQNRNNDKQPSPDDYLRQDVYDTAGNGYIALTLVVALILNFLPLPDNALLFRPDFVALITLYWCVQYPHKIGMSVAFMMGLMMDVANINILGQHALAYCIAVYLTLILGRRLRLFNAWQQAPQIGFILFAMQTVMIIVAILGGMKFPGWEFYFTTVTGSLAWIPVSLLLSMPLKQKPDSHAL